MLVAFLTRPRYSLTRPRYSLTLPMSQCWVCIALCTPAFPSSLPASKLLEEMWWLLRCYVLESRTVCGKSGLEGLAFLEEMRGLLPDVSAVALDNLVSRTQNEIRFFDREPGIEADGLYYGHPRRLMIAVADTAEHAELRFARRDDDDSAGGSAGGAGRED